MDFVQHLDPSKLVLVETILSFSVLAFDAPSYNLPIFLFGIYAQENSDAIQSLQTFTYLLSGSILYDLIWMYNHPQHWFIKVVTILTLVLKAPTLLAFVTTLHQRGAQFSNLGFRGSDLGGATVWSMPGGFTSSGRDGYQTVDEPADIQTPKPLGSTPTPSNQNAPGAYHAV